MSFQRNNFSDFFKLLKSVKGHHFEERAIAENFILEERLTEAREDSYAHYINSPQDFGEWQGRHNEYVSGKIEVTRGIPETFTDLNGPNLRPEIEKDQLLIRVENLVELVKIAQYDEHKIVSLIDSIKRFIDNHKDEGAAIIVEEFLSDCNKRRDSRPIFVGFWGEIKDLVEGNDDKWPNKVRDRFGLGHFDPMEGDHIPVLLLCYRVADVIGAKTKDRNFAAIPTVLDGKTSPFFCPTPQKGWEEGQSLSLTPGTENEYGFNCEIVHQYIEYKPSHVYRFGWITESPGKTCEEARRIHFEYLRYDFKYYSQL